MGRREELEAELALLAVEERWAAAKEARRDKETPATLREYQEAHDALTEARADFRAKRQERGDGPGDATVKPRGARGKMRQGRATVKAGE